jgi:sirohydrochlorin ferrochelatase
MTEKQGIIIVDHGSRRPQSNDMLEHVAGLFAERFSDDFDIVEPAHMELAMPDIAAAYARCVERGAMRITLLPFFLAQGKHWTKDIPSLTSQAAEQHPGTRYTIAEPLGVDDLILDLLRKRADAEGQPVLASGEADPRLAEVEPSKRRVQCATCPFKVTADGQVVVRPESGVNLADLASRAAST